MTDDDFNIKRVHHSKPMFPSVVVAIPARNEADQIVACLRAIDGQRTTTGGVNREAVGVVCLVNNSSDTTFEVVLAEAHHLAMPVRAFDVTLPIHASHAGGARRAAMNLAAVWLAEGGHRDGAVLTTDADSQPARDWIACIQTALQRGADGVAGPIELYPIDAEALPPHVKARGLHEARYETLLTELHSRLDPRAHDPWPRHSTEAGANLAVTLHAYRAVGGVPMMACGEDRALIARLERFGFRVRHDPAPKVMTSGRLEGRASGGVADTIRHRCAVPEATCDPYLEPAWNARFRALWRGRVRQSFARHGPVASLRMFGSNIEAISAPQSFDVLWDALEARDPRLSRKLLRPADLPREIDAASVMVKRLRASHPIPQIHPDDSSQYVPAE